MKQLVIVLVAGFLSLSFVQAGENPKLFNEIQRKIKVDWSKFNLCDRNTDYVLVEFMVVDGEIDVIAIHGSKGELEEAMMQELESMFIKTEADPKKLYQYKFSFRKE